MAAAEDEEEHAVVTSLADLGPLARAKVQFMALHSWSLLEGCLSTTSTSTS